MNKLLVLLIAIFTSCTATSAQYTSSDIIKAADMVLDANSFSKAHMVLTVCGVPINYDASEEFAKRFSKNYDEYRKSMATYLYIYWHNIREVPRI